MDRVFWSKGDPLTVPLNSIKGGYESNGEPLYIGRARNGTDVFPG